MLIQQKGGIPILLIGVIIVATGILAVIGAGSAAIFGEAPKCPTDAGKARPEKEINNILEKGGVTINDAEATSLGKIYVGQAIDDLRVCFTPALAHASGKIKLGPVSPSFYVSAGVDLSGNSPKATNLDIKVGALPNVPILSTKVTKAVTDIINQNLSKFEMKKKYSANFVDGNVTIKKLN